MSYTIETGGSVEDKQSIEKQLFEFNLAHFPKDLRGRYKELNLYVKNEEGHVVGGILAEVCWNWLEIDILILDESLRGLGYGSKLMQQIEQLANKHQCDFIKVDTLSFQALEFYQKHGYEVYGTLDNVGREFKHYYLKKDL